jgi:hypothetical protein
MTKDSSSGGNDQAETVALYLPEFDSEEKQKGWMTFGKGSCKDRKNYSMIQELSSRYN